MNKFGASLAVGRRGGIATRRVLAVFARPSWCPPGGEIAAVRRQWPPSPCALRWSVRLQVWASLEANACGSPRFRCRCPSQDSASKTTASSTLSFFVDVVLVALCKRTCGDALLSRALSPSKIASLRAH